MSKNRNKTMITALILSAALFTLGGCGLLDGKGTEEIDPPQTVTYTEEGKTSKNEKSEGTKGKKENKAEEAAESTVMTELYLIDKHGYVVPQSMALPGTKSVAKQALEHLVKDGPVTEMLPDGFSAVLPAGTEISVDMDGETAIVNFSNEFKNYEEKDEQKIMEAVAWTLTQFDAIEKVRLKLNGNELTEMPVAGTHIGDGLTRGKGINLDTTEVVDITNTKALTLYYLAGEEGAYYYVPVTRRVGKESGNDIENIVNELAKGPSYTSNLLTEFVPDVALIDEPTVVDGKVTLNFNEFVYGSFDDKKIISDHLLNTLVLSLTEQKGIESVSVMVNCEAELVKEDGEKLSEPVTRPENVNTGSF